MPCASVLTRSQPTLQPLDGWITDDPRDGQMCNTINPLLGIFLDIHKLNSKVRGTQKIGESDSSIPGLFCLVFYIRLLQIFLTDSLVNKYLIWKLPHMYHGLWINVPKEVQLKFIFHVLWAYIHEPPVLIFKLRVFFSAIFQNICNPGGVLHALF